jgi:N-acetylglucosamine kinase-like BadF-type ATPase
MSYYLGVDIGGSKSHALITDAEGHVVGFGAAGTGNHERVGYDGLAHVLCAITQQAAAQAEISLEQIVGAGFGLCGYDWDSERPAHVNAINSIGLSCPFELVNDAMLGLIAGSHEGVGISVIAGTSCNACGRDRSGNHGKTIGMGQMLGEAGGGGELVTRALWAIAHAHTKRGRPTRLTDAFLQATGAANPEALLEGYIEGHYLIDASYAPLVFKVAAEGDSSAVEAVRWTGDELGHLAIAVMRQLDLGSEPFDIVLAGNYFKGSPLVIEALRARVMTETRQARYVRLEAPPVVGGVLLGMEVHNMPLEALQTARSRLSVWDVAHQNTPA